jgi:hypothetical protein
MAADIQSRMNEFGHIRNHDKWKRFKMDMQVGFGKNWKNESSQASAGSSDVACHSLPCPIVC